MYAAETKTNIETTVSQLNPAIRKALLKALTNYDIALATDEKDDSTEWNSLQTTTTSSHDGEELLEESTAADLKALNLYNSYLANGMNFTQNVKDDNEIIHTIIVKAAAKVPTEASVDTSERTENDQVVIQFGAPDPVKDSDVHIETFQIARSVKTNEIDDDESNENNHEQNNIKVTTYKPVATTTITTTTRPKGTTTEEPKTTTTPAPTHNDDGENIERVSQNDVKIFQAPLVAAFTVQQDALGLPKNVISLFDQLQQPPAVAKPIQEFAIQSSGNIAPQPINKGSTFEPAIPTTPLTLQLPSENNAPSFILSQSLELPSTKEAAFTTFALEQKRRQLEEQIAQLQQQQRQQEQLLRYRHEEENRRLQQSQFQQAHFQNQQQNQQFQQFRTPDLGSSVQVIPSLSFPTQQLLPVREPNEFKPKPINSFTPSQPLPLFFGQTAPLLSTGPQLPLRPAQQFQTSFANLNPVTASEPSRSRHRVFRQESGTGNFGLNSIDTNFPPIYPIFNADNQLQSLLLQSGIAGRSNEDLNIITKVLSLNHGIGIPAQSNSFNPFQQGRFVRSTSN